MKRKLFLFFLLIPIMVPAAENIRSFLTTGPWYPSDPQRLGKMLDGFLKDAAVHEVNGPLRGIIAPHAGYEYSGPCAASAYRCLAPSQPVRRVILLGASHHYGFYGACVADFSAFATPLGQVPVDMEICRSLSQQRFFKNDSPAMQNEHSLENQLPFLQKMLGNAGYKIVPILFGALRKNDFAKVAAAIAPYCDAETVLVASSDLTHYGKYFSYTPFQDDVRQKLTALDTAFIETMRTLDFENYYRYHERTGITACGFVPIGIMIRLLEKRNIGCTVTDYYKSGDLNNDYSTSVSYAALVFSAAGGPPGDPIGLSTLEQKLLLELARSTLRDRFRNSRMAEQKENQFPDYPKLGKSLGVFVTLRKGVALRGCIGSIIGVEPLYLGVAANAIHAAMDDPRFPPLRENELAGTEIEISVMTPLQPVSDYRSIRLGTDGVVIRDGRSQAVFLPQVAAETGWDLDQFLGSLCAKAGLDHDAYRRSPSMQFFVFQAQVFGEKEQRQ
jgi:AmmeMemoRadiSam system protein B/AmmeMemoRadiSam system protein A